MSIIDEYIGKGDSIYLYTFEKTNTFFVQKDCTESHGVEAPEIFYSEETARERFSEFVKFAEEYDAMIDNDFE